MFSGNARYTCFSLFSLVVMLGNRSNYVVLQPWCFWLMITVYIICLASTFNNHTPPLSFILVIFNRLSFFQNNPCLLLDIDEHDAAIKMTIYVINEVAVLA